MKWISMCALLVAGLAAVLPLNAQTSESTNDQLSLLLQLKGLWETNAATMKTNGKETSFGYHADFETTAANNGLLMHEWAAIPDVGSLDGTNLIGINPHDRKIHWFSVDNMGTTHEHIGQFADNRHFSMQFAGIQEGHEYRETLVLELTDPNTMNLKQVTMLDGVEIAAIAGTFHRKRN